jgi:hypothetical protein
MDLARSFEPGIPLASESLPVLYFSESHAAISCHSKIWAAPGCGRGGRGWGGGYARTRWDRIHVDRVEGAWRGLGRGVVGKVRVVVQEDFLLVVVRLGTVNTDIVLGIFSLSFLCFISLSWLCIGLELSVLYP